MEDLFKDTTYGQLALAKLHPVGPGFMLFEAGWMGEANQRDCMEVKGADFREAKSGPRKGQVCVLVKGSERVAYVTAAEIAAVKSVLSDWFEYFDEPQHVGWYECSVPEDSVVKIPEGQNIWWSGYGWYLDEDCDRGPLRLEPGDCWRGLARPSAELDNKYARTA